MNEIKGSLEKTTQINLYRIFSGKSLQEIFHFMCFQMKTFQENEQIFFFFFKELRRHIFMCKTKWKKNILIVFDFLFWLNIFFWKTFQENFLSFGNMWKDLRRLNHKQTFSMWNWKKKSISLFGRKLTQIYSPV